MRSGFFHQFVLAVFCALAFGGLAAAADAAEPTLYELPAATHAGSLSIGDDGAVWFSASHGQGYEGPETPALDRLDPDGTIAEVPVSGLSGFGAPVVGPGGELWVLTEVKVGSGKWQLGVARLSTSGQVERRYPIGRAGPGITSLAVGTDDIWVEFWPSRHQEVVERLDPATGALDRFPLARDAYSETLVASGKSAWFTERVEPEEKHRGAARIGRIGPTGKVTRWAAARDDYPNSIAVGEGGEVWFGATLYSSVGGRIGHISPSGKVREFRVHHGLPYSIALAGGRLWFASSFGGGIYRALDSIDAAGNLSEPVCADPSCRLESTVLATAPDGSLWYGLTMPHSIGGGGFTQIMEGETIAEEGGFIAHLTP